LAPTFSKPSGDLVGDKQQDKIYNQLEQANCRGKTELGMFNN
jgi:hypothetical protein